MADGDVAASLGWHIPADTDDKRQGAAEIRKALDKSASHQISGTHPWTAITGKPTYYPYDPTNIIAGNIPSDGGSSVQADINNLRGGQLSSDVYNRTLTTSYRTLSVRSDGLLGWAPSTRRFKKNIREVQVTVEQLRAFLVRTFEYKVGVGGDGTEQLGHIAEEAHDLGLTWLVEYDGEGVPFGIRYELVGSLALRLAQLAWDQIDHITARLDKAGL